MGASYPELFRIQNNTEFRVALGLAPGISISSKTIDAIIAQSAPSPHSETRSPDDQPDAFSEQQMRAIG